MTQGVVTDREVTRVVAADGGVTQGVVKRGDARGGD